MILPPDDRLMQWLTKLQALLAVRSTCAYAIKSEAEPNHPAFFSKSLAAKRLLPLAPWLLDPRTFKTLQFAKQNR